MKPTEEQVIAWVREAGAYCHYGDFNMGHSYELQPDQLERFATIAYEAGRKDENEACAKMCEDLDHFAADCIDCAAGIRTRRQG